MQTIHEHLDLLNRQAERWQRDHADAMRCHQTEDMMGFAAFLWERVKLVGKKDPIDPSSADAESKAKAYTALYAQLNAVMTRIGRLADEDRANGYELYGWDEFVVARREVADVALVPMEKVLRGLRDVEAGRVKPMGDVRRELLDRLRG